MGFQVLIIHTTDLQLHSNYIRSNTFIFAQSSVDLIGPVQTHISLDLWTHRALRPYSHLHDETMNLFIQ
jgi:hypothetical protein